MTRHKTRTLGNEIFFSQEGQGVAAKYAENWWGPVESWYEDRDGYRWFYTADGRCYSGWPLETLPEGHLHLNPRTEE